MYCAWFPLCCPQVRVFTPGGKASVASSLFDHSVTFAQMSPLPESTSDPSVLSSGSLLSVPLPRRSDWLEARLWGHFLLLPLPVVFLYSDLYP